MSGRRPRLSRAEGAPPDRSWLGPAAAAVAARPRLWATAGRQLVVLAEPGWWRRSPHLPLPAAGYLRFRLVTAYGDPAATPGPHDVVAYLAWCREERRRTATAGVRRRRNRPFVAGAGR